MKIELLSCVSVRFEFEHRFFQFFRFRPSVLIQTKTERINVRSIQSERIIQNHSFQNRGQFNAIVVRFQSVD